MTFELIILGALTGFISAFFGIGGSSIDTPILRMIFHFPPHLALATPLPLTLLTAIGAYWVYGRKNYFQKRTALLCLLGSVPGMIIGSYFSKFVPGKFLMLLTAAMLFLIGLDFIIKRYSDPDDRDHHMDKYHHPPYLVISIAAAIGILSGLLANGGGIFFVPAFVFLLGMKMREAIVTSLVIVAVTSVPGSLVHYSLGHIDIFTTAALALGAVPMAWLGAKADIHTRSETIKLLFGSLLVSFSIYFFANQLVN